MSAGLVSGKDQLEVSFGGRCVSLVRDSVCSERILFEGGEEVDSPRLWKAAALKLSEKCRRRPMAR